MKCKVIKVDKPWGHELIWAKTPEYAGKILFIRDGHKLSLQYHVQKEETIFILKGTLTFQYENDNGVLENIILKPGDAHHIPPNRKHRMIADQGDVELSEVSTAQLDDVVRLEDSYGRS